MGEAGDASSVFPSSLCYLGPFSSPSTFNEDSFLLARLSSTSLLLCCSPSPGTKHTPDRLPWQCLTRAPSLCLAAVTPASSASSISIALASRQQWKLLLLILPKFSTHPETSPDRPTQTLQTFLVFPWRGGAKTTKLFLDVDFGLTAAFLAISPELCSPLHRSDEQI